VRSQRLAGKTFGLVPRAGVAAAGRLGSRSGDRLVPIPAPEPWAVEPL